MPDTSLPIFLSPGIKSLLAENDTDLAQLLRAEGYEFDSAIAGDPTKPGQKDVALILIASAALIAAATPVITRLLETLANKPIVVTKRVPQEVVARNGKKKTKWVDDVTIFQPEKTTVKQETSIGGFGLSISLKSETG